MNKARRTKVQAILSANPTLKPKLAYVLSGIEFSSLDIKGKVLVVKSDDLDESIFRSLKPMVQEAGGLGVMGISSDTEIDSEDLDTIEKYVADQRAALAAKAAEEAAAATQETPSGEAEQSV